MGFYHLGIFKRRRRKKGIKEMHSGQVIWLMDVKTKVTPEGKKGKRQGIKGLSWNSLNIKCSRAMRVSCKWLSLMALLDAVKKKLSWKDKIPVFSWSFS